MARRLGREQEANAFDDKAATLRERINQFLWDEQTGLYLDLDLDLDLDGAGQPIRISTIASLMPLWAGVPGRLGPVGDAEAMATTLRLQTGDNHYLHLPVTVVHAGNRLVGLMLGALDETSSAEIERLLSAKSAEGSS